MAAITSAQADLWRRTNPRAGKLMAQIPGLKLMVTNFDATTGGIVGSASDLAGTTQALFTVGASGGTTPRISIAESGAGGGKTGDYILTIKPGTLSANRDVLFPDSIGAGDIIVTEAMTQTLTNKILTEPTIDNFTSAQHDHSSAAMGGAVTASAALTGTTALYFTVANGAATPELNITTVGSAGNYTMTLQVPTLSAAATITLPASTGTLATIGGTETLTAKTLTTPTLTTPVISTGLSASGSASNDFSTSTGAFLTSTGAVTIGATGTNCTVNSGSLILNNGTTPILTVQSGKTNSGYIEVKGKTSGMLKILAADATAQTVTFGPAAQTSGAGSATIPDLAGGAHTISMIGLAETVTGSKTYTTGTVDFRGAVTATGANNLDFSGSSGTFLTPTGAVTLGTGTVTVTGTSLIIGNSTTPVLTVQSGKTNTGYIEMKGKTSGMLKITANDATAQTITLTTAAQTSGAATITIPDLAGVNQTLSFLAKAETLSGAKTFSGGVLASGANDNDFSGGTGQFKTSTGNNVLGGDVTISGSKTFSTGTGAVKLLGAVTIAADIDTETAVGMVLGASTCTSLAVGATDITTTLKGAVKGDVGAAEGYVVFTTIHDVSAAEIDAGHTVVTVPAGRQFQLVSCKAIAYGGAVTVTTTVDLLDAATKLVAFAQANLTQSTVLTDGGTGAAVLADGASYTARTAGNDITVGKTGGAVTTATGVRFIISYILI